MGLILSFMWAMSAWAQDADGGFEPKASNPGDEATVLIRELGEETDAGLPMSEPVPVPVVVAPVEESHWDLTAKLSASLRLNYGGSTLFPFDANRRTSIIAPLVSRIRVGPEFYLGAWGLIAEADAATGAIIGIPPIELTGPEQPVPPLRALESRKIYLEYSWSSGFFKVGQQTSHWGLGILTNDGAHDSEAGDFGQQHYGNLTYRALFSQRPFSKSAGLLRAFELMLAADLIVRDTFGEFARGDRAFQGVLAIKLNKDPENMMGLYSAYRTQKNISGTDKTLEIVILDFAGQWQVLKHRHRELKLGWEIVGVLGAQTSIQSEGYLGFQRVNQLGWAAKSEYRAGQWALYFDTGYASGDSYYTDIQAANFRFDRDYKVGLILFDQVLAYQSGRSNVRVNDLHFKGGEAGAGGAVMRAWYLFPRAKYAMSEGLDIYGGPLFAFSTAPLTDPLNSRIPAVNINALGGRPGSFLGTELDLGMQARMKPVPELTISLTAEGGLFLPGDAYALPDGDVMEPVAFGRLRLAISI